MARYQYTGPGPIEALSGGDVIRPGDIREYDEAPDWGPWELLDEPGAAEAMLAASASAMTQVAADIRAAQPAVAAAVASALTPKEF